MLLELHGFANHPRRSSRTGSKNPMNTWQHITKYEGGLIFLRLGGIHNAKALAVEIEELKAVLDKWRAIGKKQPINTNMGDKSWTAKNKISILPTIRSILTRKRNSIFSVLSVTPGLTKIPPMKIKSLFAQSAKLK
jgi:hypothetical protein